MKGTSVLSDIGNPNKSIPEAFGNNKEMTKECAINILIKDTNTDIISDGCHTFGELYEFRKVYNAVLFNEWTADHHKIMNPNWKHDTSGTEPVFLPKYNVHKSWRHNDGELCFGGGWFIVMAMLPSGQISNHYKAEDWGLFKIPEKEIALFPYDGHTPKDVLSRLFSL